MLKASQVPLRRNQRSPRVRKAMLVGCLASLVCLGCSGAESTGPVAFAGRFALATVNGVAPPYALFDIPDTFTYLVLGDTLEFDGHGSVTEFNTSRVIEDGQARTESQTGKGSYTKDGSTITIGWTVGIYDYHLSGDSLSVYEPINQATWVYRRR